MARPMPDRQIAEQSYEAPDPTVSESAPKAGPAMAAASSAPVQLAMIRRTPTGFMVECDHGTGRPSKYTYNTPDELANGILEKFGGAKEEQSEPGADGDEGTGEPMASGSDVGEAGGVAGGPVDDSQG